eukprot:TRINITY_DN60696_c0_g1_i1.p1 TRINITY_DN60696_c0_g1~~TRINITY_DN60696_c0_g1_i1.p1  ORF type:complete len:496 (-),score=87.88 TRINITY_DN60696_c0_g1_i1:218-1705(-)
MPSGTLKSWNCEKHFGFIVPDDAGGDIFVHRSALVNMRSLTKGDRVQYEAVYDQSRGKWQAGRCALLGGSSIENRDWKLATEIAKSNSADAVISPGHIMNPHGYDTSFYTASAPALPKSSNTAAQVRRCNPSSPTAAEEASSKRCVTDAAKIDEECPLLFFEDAEESESDEEHSASDAQEEVADVEVPDAEEEELPLCKEIQVCPSDVRFTHASISARFRSGLSLDDAIDSITKKELAFEDFPAVICVERDGQLFSLNNRRVFVARCLHHKGLLSTMQVKVVPFSDAYVQHERDGLSKWSRSFSTSNNGVAVSVRSKYRKYQTKQLAEAQLKRADKQMHRAKVNSHMEAMKPVITTMLPPPKGLATGSRLDERVKKLKWHLQEKLPSEFMDTLGRQYGVCWEIYISSNGKAGIKAFPRAAEKDLTPERYSLGCLALREAVRRRYQFKPKSNSSKLTSVRLPSQAAQLWGANQASPKDARAAEKQKTMDKKGRRRR